MARHSEYATVSHGPKKFSVCARRIGTKERLAVIATCTDESSADTIVEALNVRQGWVTKMEVPAVKRLDETLERLTAEKSINTSLQIKIRNLENDLNTVKRLRDGLQSDLHRAIIERDAAHKKAQEPAKV